MELLTVLNLLLLMASIGFYVKAKAKLESASKLELSFKIREMCRENGVFVQFKKEMDKNIRDIKEAFELFVDSFRSVLGVKRF